MDQTQILARRSCGTCRDRRIRCDLALPTCANCARANQECQGYGLRLSWPRPGDKRRTILVDTPSRNTLTADPFHHNRGDWPFVNMHSWHISSWLNLVEGRMGGEKASVIFFNVFSLVFFYPFRVLMIYWQRHIRDSVTTDHVALVDREERVNIAPLLSEDIQEGHRFLLTPPLGSLTRLLLQIGLSDVSSPSRAVFNGILALSCLHLWGDQYASVYKARATSLLRASLNPESSIKVAVSNLVASMLLYLYETVHQSSPYAWAVYLCGVKRLAQSKIVTESAKSAHPQIVFNWVYYHETIAQFGQLYWTQKHPSPVCHGKSSRQLRGHPDMSEVDPGMIGCSIDVLEGMSTIFDIAMRPIVSSSRRQELLGVESQLRRMISALSKLTNSGKASSSLHEITQLHCIAALIYMNRATLGYDGTEPSHQALVEKGLEVLSNIVPCATPWALFIIGCEVKLDLPRLAILETISRSKQESRTGHLDVVKGLVEAVWNYDDLDPDMRLDYNKKLLSIVREAPWMPPFV
ncbi:unnamed protein product [Clonostachys solani]|uniref:Zn(2)-C6 fungal-type domain-containing protein n=1 Tax=Clonostachys solani TaxID=160281 RepID=A0A9N9ZB73_9HYPO|nr:unnamed protein product [Clonostachys solani]